jgi:hypothetical protein
MLCQVGKDAESKERGHQFGFKADSRKRGGTQEDKARSAGAPVTFGAVSDAMTTVSI